ncbi:MAG: hypothetical protein MUE96_10610 [Bacteroidia bacterium]|jgi:hypothetical protein|nr:hypothetical protein [Bacteroidia bacterium]
MSISIHNYETYLIDYLDGSLDPITVSEVLLFLEQHPAIKQEFLELQGPLFAAEPDPQPDLDFLKKPLYQQAQKDIQLLLIAELENQITEQEQTMLQRYEALYPQLQHDRHLYATTVSEPDIFILFPDKQKLKKAVLFRLFRLQQWQAAAAIFIAVVGIGWFMSNQEIGNQTVAIQTKTSQQVQSVDKPKTRVAAHLPKHAVLPESKTAQLPSKNMEVKQSQIQIIDQRMVSSVFSIKEPATVKLTPVVVAIANKPKSMATPLATDTLKEKHRYLSLSELMMAKLKETTTTLQTKATTTVTDAAGIVVERDEEHNRISRLGIAALGFEWSQSK